MSDIETLSNWIIANEDKKGTPDFDTVAKALIELSEQEESISEKAARLRDRGRGRINSRRRP